MADILTVSEVHELDGLLERSRERPVWLFKHSLTCGVSTRAHREYRSFVAANGATGDAETAEAAGATETAGADFTLLEVQNARPLSRAVAETTGIRHQSPQAILLRDGKAVWSASHFNITADSLTEASAD